MKIFMEDGPGGSVVLIMSKEEGQALVEVCERATLDKAGLMKAKPFARSTKKHRLATHIEENLPVF